MRICATKMGGRVWFAALMLALPASCTAQEAQEGTGEGAATGRPPAQARVLFLHHSTGECIWNGGVARWFQDYNRAHSVRYTITEQAFPKESPYGWENYPYDYWNIWVRNAGGEPFRQEPTLEMLSKKYDVIVLKHCFPVSNIEADTGRPDVASSEKRIENYRLQYAALKKKIRAFRKVRFLVWTGAAQVASDTDEAMARRARQFFEWVRTRWDEKGDNIYLWDFYSLQTEGGLYFKPAYASGDAHPNQAFSKKVAPMFCRRLVDVIQGRGDSGSILGAAPADATSPAAGPQTQPAPAPAEPAPSDTTTPEPAAPAVTPAPSEPVKPPSTHPGCWVMDNAEDAAAAKRLWAAAVKYAKDGEENAIAVRFADARKEDWGEYGVQCIVETRPPEKNRDVSTYRYVALRVKTDRDMELVVQLETRPNPAGPPEQSHFGFSAYLHPKAGAWRTFTLDLTKLELAAEGEEAYAAAGRPSRPMQLTMMKFITNKKNEAAKVLLDDITFYRDLPKALAGSLVQP
jgi:hypothetical protein